MQPESNPESSNPESKLSIVVRGILCASLGYVFMRLLLHFVPIVMVFPAAGVIYKDDVGVCYTYERAACSERDEGEASPF